ncbi:hypothetical protein CF70_009140 [Cupriavidus sp. SK-3]|uniref:potassium channel family protein n=1 Tax=Cupriavidus sp. SK-3 TaxID=1470558 RepID=UPI00044D6F89|nr:potassium channel family protein [Cupriavidus sp. SK-3]KDP89298.1 hypothetical protein CF70_009140 [Cupriavidus sp. SK-3]
MARVQWWREHPEKLRGGSMVALLVLLLLLVFFVPFSVAPNSLHARLMRELLLSLILLTGVVAVSDRRLQFLIVALVAGAALLVRWAGWLFAPAHAHAQGMIIGETALISLGLLGVVIGIRVFSPGTVTFDRILGAVSLYILIGVVWAEADHLVSIHIPGAYAGIPNTYTSSDHSVWLYFSFVTLTTVGYGDITPIANPARALAILEALIGQLYPAIVLARLVSLRVASESSGP